MGSRLSLSSWILTSGPMERCSDLDRPIWTVLTKKTLTTNEVRLML